MSRHAAILATLTGAQWPICYLIMTRWGFIAENGPWWSWALVFSFCSCLAYPILAHLWPRAIARENQFVLCEGAALTTFLVGVWFWFTVLMLVDGIRQGLSIAAQLSGQLFIFIMIVPVAALMLVWVWVPFGLLAFALLNMRLGRGGRVKRSDGMLTGGTTSGEAVSV
jgi:hypothetical protein